MTPPTEKSTALSTVKTEKAPPTPLEILNARVTEAKAASRTEAERLRVIWMAHRNSTASIPAGTGIHEEVRLQMDYVNRGNALRSQSQNYRPDAFESLLLDVAGNRPLLEDALRHVRQLHADHLKRPKPIPAKIETDGRHLFQPESPHAMPIPAPRPPIRGPWGQDEALDLPKEIARLSSEIEGFPVGQSYSEIVGGLNGVASALRQAESSKPEPKRCDVGWTVPSHM
jgi:hypothetical protein